MGIITVTIWVIGVLGILNQSPDPPSIVMSATLQEVRYRQKAFYDTQLFYRPVSKTPFKEGEENSWRFRNRRCRLPTQSIFPIKAVVALRLLTRDL